MHTLNLGTRSGAPALEESKHKQLCAATKLLGCQAIGEERQNWVSCRRCRLPYHAACSGIAAQRKEFVCCLDVETQELIRNDINAIGLHFYDRSWYVWFVCTVVIVQRETINCKSGGLPP